MSTKRKRVYATKPARSGIAQKRRVSPQSITVFDVDDIPKKMTRAKPSSTGRPELKGLDTEISANPVLSTTNSNVDVFCINLPGEGTASYQRIGRKIKLLYVRLKIHGKWVMTQTASYNVQPNTFRWILVWDKQPGGAAPNFDDIFGHTVQDGTVSSSTTDALTYANTHRFSVIREGHMAMDPGGMPAINANYLREQDFFIDEFVKLQGRKTFFNSSVATPGVADIANGALYLIVRSTQSVTGTYANYFQIWNDTTARVRYTDA